METIDTFKIKYQAFLDSGMTATAYCEQAGIPHSRFYYWQKKIRTAAAASSGEFMPVSINNHCGKVVLVSQDRRHVNEGQQPIMAPTCEISFPNGVTVRLTGSVSSSMLSQLVTLG